MLPLRIRVGKRWNRPQNETDLIWAGWIKWISDEWDEELAKPEWDD